jgi:TonB-linked SusC/RagA family outer membrane protein
MHLTAFSNALWRRLAKEFIVSRVITTGMRLTCIFLLAGALHAFAAGNAQQVTLNKKNVTIEQVFKDIRQQTGYNFLFTTDLLQQARKVSIDVKNATLEQVLELCLKDQPFVFKIKGKSILITERAAPKQATELSNTLLQGLPPALVNVSGTLKDEKGEPLAGITVAVKGTRNMTITNEDGNFTLSNVPANAALVFAGVNIDTYETALNGRRVIVLTLKTKVSQLDEVQIIGYGSTTRRKSTGSVSSITSEEIANQPVGNPLNALQGRIAGAIVTQANGLPGARVTIQIRGVNSLNSGQQPLYIIDGIPFNMQDQAVPATNDLNSFGIFAANRGISPFSMINPSDIERIDILKDADATAIYGTKAANGVVLVTTKKGKSGKTKLDVNVYRGAGKVSRFIDMMNTDQYLQLRREAYANDGSTPNTANAPDLLVWDPKQNTDWQRKYMGGTASTTDAQASVSGGDTRTRFLLGAGYHRETTVFPGDFSDSRISVRFNADHNSLDRKFNATLSANYAYNNSNMLSTDLSTVYNLPPNMPLYNADGSLYWNSNFTNPESYLLQKYIGKTNNLMANSILRYTILPGLDLKTSFSFNKVTLDQNQQNPAGSKSNIGATPTHSARFATTDQQSYTIEPQITYTKNISKGKLMLLAGTTWQSSVNKGTTITADNYSSPELLSTPAGAGTYSSVSAPYTLYKYNSFFGRINYDWASKYIVNINFRRDGSSRFGSNYHFGNFGSLGAAWLFTNEKSIADALPFLSFGKLRASYGVTGNDQIQDYQYITLFTATSGTAAYQGSSILSPSRINNPDLRWETNKKLGIGLDLAFFHDKVQFTTDYYENRTGSQLGFLRLAIQSGFNAFTSNFDALIQNKGWEFELNTTNISNKSFEWKTTFNLTIPSTKLLQASSQYFSYNQFALGKPLSYVLKYIYKGVDPQTGRPLYQDKTKDSLTFTPNVNTDREVTGYTAPHFYGGINNRLRYKGVELSFFFQFTKQEGNILPSSTPGALGSGNQTTLWLNRWQNTSSVTSLPKATTTTSIYGSYGSSDAVWGDASFARLRNVVLSYSFPQAIAKRMKMDNLRVYVQGQNLFTWTKNKYVSDPETIATVNQSSVVMPPLRVFTAGINCTF